MRQFSEALARGDLYPRWLPRSFEGLGSPTFYFYPPLAFFLAGGFGAAGLATGPAINAAVLILTWLSGAAMRLWLGGRSGCPLLWACVYMIAPYHLADWYRRAAFAEYSAFVWLPLIALAIEAFPRRWAPPLLAVSYAALVLSHLPVALLASLGLVAPLAIVTADAGRNLPRLAHIGLALAVGLALAGLYLAPALTLQSHISERFLWGPEYRPWNWSLFATSSPVPWMLRSRHLSIAAALAVLGLAGALAVRRGGGSRVLFWGAVAGVTAILALGLPAQVWTLPILSKVQFPWRILAVTEFAAITAVALAPRASPVALALAGALALPAYARTVEQAQASLAHAAAIRQFDGPMPDAVEYLPAGFAAGAFDPSARIADLRTLRGPEALGPAKVVAARPDGGMSLQVEAPGTVILRRFSFPAWRVSRDGLAVPVTPSGPGRLLSFRAEPGRYEVGIARLPQERWGAAASLIGLLGLAGLAAPALGRRRPRPD